MKARQDLRLAEVSDELRFGPNGELRESFAKSGRIHVDRWLPFLVLHRSASPAGSRLTISASTRRKIRL